MAICSPEELVAAGRTSTPDENSRGRSRGQRWSTWVSFLVFHAVSTCVRFWLRGVRVRVTEPPTPCKLNYLAYPVRGRAWTDVSGHEESSLLEVERWESRRQKGSQVVLGPSE